MLAEEYLLIVPLAYELQSGPNEQISTKEDNFNYNFSIGFCFRLTNYRISAQHKALHVVGNNLPPMSRTCIICVLSIFLLACESKKKKAPELLMASRSGGPGAAILTFYTDSSVDFIPGIFSSTSEGTFELKDSVIQLHGIPVSGLIKSNRYLITRRHPLNPNWSDKLLVPVDSNLNVVDSFGIIIIQRDWRDSINSSEAHNTQF